MHKGPGRDAMWSFSRPVRLRGSSGCGFVVGWDAKMCPRTLVFQAGVVCWGCMNLIIQLLQTMD